PLRLELAREFGADHTIDFSEHNSSKARAEHVRDLTDGWGPEVIIEVTGVSEVIPEGLDMIGVGGTYILIGSIGFGRPCDFDPAVAVRKLVTMKGVIRYHPRYLREALRFLDRTRDRYSFDKLLDRRFTLDQVQEAIESSARRELARATIVPG
ncbi:MAG: zinc-binding dehydrogenase, partial [Rhodospirillaceae bacterium]|nr:zinc-binding dehydrogenase [Rhodospirillaceae bacterium]